MSKNDKIQPIDLGITATIGGQSSLVGQKISINLKERSFFGIGNVIWLTPERYWCEIPAGMKEEDYAKIEHALTTNQIVLGKKYITPIDKPAGVIDEYWAIIQRGNCLNNKELKDKIAHVFVRQDGIDRGHTLMEIFLACKAREEKGHHRNDVIQWLETAVNEVGGQLRLYEPPEDEQGLKTVVLHSDGSMEGYDHEGNAIEPEEPTPPPPPVGHKRGTQSKQSALSDLD